MNSRTLYLVSLFIWKHLIITIIMINYANLQISKKCYHIPETILLLLTIRWMRELLRFLFFYCSNDGHYHSLLPLDTIVPYCQYSLSFILCAVFDKLYSLLTVEEIVYKYSISKSTIYRWVEKYSIYMRQNTFSA